MALLRRSRVRSIVGEPIQESVVRPRVVAGSFAEDCIGVARRLDFGGHLTIHNLITPRTWTVGLLRLLVPAFVADQRRLLGTLHMIRFDSMPWACKVEAKGIEVTVERLVHHSGQVCLMYPVAEFGEMALRTGTLPERPEPYSLSVELARGTLDRFRNQLGMWRESGLAIAAEIDEWAEAATRALAEAVLLVDSFERQTELAHQSLNQSMRGIFALCNSFTRQVAQWRRQEGGAAAKLGIRITAEGLPSDWLAQVGGEFQLVCIGDHLEVPAAPVERRSPLARYHAEAGRAGRTVMLGPIWDAGKGGLPASINEIASFEEKRRAAREYFIHGLNRIEEQPDWLYVASGLNGIGHRHLSYPQQMQMVVDLLQLVDEFNRQVPVLISLDHPWSERLAWSVGGAQGLQIADILLRQDVRISGLGLEINLDYWPLGSLPRDPLQWLELIDVWSLFGVPLMLFLRIPTGRPTGDAAVDGLIRNSFGGPEKWTYVETVLSLAMSRPAVQAVIWNEWGDRAGPPYPLAGLFDAGGGRKSILSLLLSVRQRLTETQ
jgi:hypothetical protein